MWFKNLFKGFEGIEEKTNEMLSDAFKRSQVEYDRCMAQSIEKLDIKDGDILLVRHPLRLSELAGSRLKDSLLKAIEKMGVNARGIILEEDADVEVLKMDKIEPSERKKGPYLAQGEVDQPWDEPNIKPPKPDRNPKERFLEKFQAILSEFEKETGTEIFTINLKRVNISKLNVLPGIKTVIAEIIFDLR